MNATQAQASVIRRVAFVSPCETCESYQRPSQEYIGADFACSLLTANATIQSTCGALTYYIVSSMVGYSIHCYSAHNIGLC
jgi:hypothetical protein